MSSVVVQKLGSGAVVFKWEFIAAFRLSVKNQRWEAGKFFGAIPGGRPNKAQAGGCDPSKLKEAPPRDTPGSSLGDRTSVALSLERVSSKVGTALNTKSLHTKSQIPLWEELILTQYR